MLANATAFAELCFMLNDGQYTKEELAEGTGLVIGTVIKYMKLLKRRKLIYVCGWKRNSDVGQWAAVWEWGPGKKDVLRPAPLTQSQYSKNYRAKKKVRETLEKHDERRQAKRGLQCGLQANGADAGERGSA